ncbi:hypothetical protein AB0D59_19285 [Streptomyces sp. NPDC048417]
MTVLDVREVFPHAPEGGHPCGQWDWIEHHTGLPIAQAIADELRGVAP